MAGRVPTRVAWTHAILNYQTIRIFIIDGPWDMDKTFLVVPPTVTYSRNIHTVLCTWYQTKCSGVSVLHTAQAERPAVLAAPHRPARNVPVIAL